MWGGFGQNQPNPNKNVIQYMGMLMSKHSLDVNIVLQMVEIMNKSVLACKDVTAILEDIFKNQKSQKILLGVEVLQYLVKNCDKGFHRAANQQSFQKSILGLMWKTRGKINLLKQMRSNKENWKRIQAKALYIIQLWYDTFMIQQTKFKHIINNYKVLRGEGVIFPPRSSNQKNLVFVQNQSPIFDNIETISKMDQQKFSKRLQAMGMVDAKVKFQSNVEKVQQKNQKSRLVNIDEISEKIAIIQSSNNKNIKQVMGVVQSMKKDLQFGKVKPNQQAYWRQVKHAADRLIQQWELKNSQLIKSQQQKYLESKLNMPRRNPHHQQVIVNSIIAEQPKREQPKQQVNLLDL